MYWEEEYKQKLVTAEEAVSIIKSGDRVAFSLDAKGGPEVLAEALAAKLGELKDVEIEVCTPIIDFGWFQPSWEESFKIIVASYISPVVRPMMDEKRADFNPRLYSLWGKAHDEGRPGIRETDVFMTVVSPPDEHGYCCFGCDIWSKKWYVQTARKVLVEVDKNWIRTYGDSLVHITEVDYFVEHTRKPREFVLPEPEEYMKAIGHYVGTLVRDGDTFGIGAGSIGRTLCPQGIFKDKHDLGYYAENLVPGVVQLVKDGVVTGKCKTFHPGKVVSNNFGAVAPEELVFIDNNPEFELYPQDYVVNIRNVAANDNMVAINAALSVDLTGQIASESIGPRMYTGSGGQPSFAIGAMLSKGGRSITMLRSTSTDGKVSRIAPFLEPGTIVTVPRNFADYIVTEYGIASLHGKTQRERAQELIAIAHPDFRAELKKQAQKLFWP
jgi:4-hydroxybutyrate CoA-transferase